MLDVWSLPFEFPNGVRDLDRVRSECFHPASGSVPRHLIVVISTATLSKKFPMLISLDHVRKRERGPLISQAVEVSPNEHEQDPFDCFSFGGSPHVAVFRDLCCPTPVEPEHTYLVKIRLGGVQSPLHGVDSLYPGHMLLFRSLKEDSPVCFVVALLNR